MEAEDSMFRIDAGDENPQFGGFFTLNEIAWGKIPKPRILFPKLTEALQEQMPDMVAVQLWQYEANKRIFLASCEAAYCFATQNFLIIKEEKGHLIISFWKLKE